MSETDTHALFERIQPLLRTDQFQDKEVAIFGVGSGGGKCVEHLTKSGVEQFILVDPDTMQVENVCRHVCGVSSLGRPKVDAVKDYILDRNPRARVTTHQERVEESNRNWLLELLQRGSHGRRVSLAVCGTDTDRSKRLINEACVQARTPAVFAGCFEKARGGEITRYRPGSACFGCVSSFLRREGIHDTFGQSNFNYAEIDIDGLADQRPEPGLGLDVEFIALIQAKAALMTLLDSTDADAELQDFAGNYILFGNRPVEGLFSTHLQSFIYDVPPQEGCLVCQDKGMNVADRAREILNGIQTN